MSKRIVKPWKCLGCGAILGLVTRNGRGIRQMMLYRQALRPDQYAQQNGHGENLPDVMALIEGYAADIKCNRCWAVRTWVPGQEAIDRIIKNYQKGRRRK